jgi:LPPG:FO 2-phospho-L-lactate transferase
LITVLAGGTGSVKLVRGLASQTTDLVIISNVGDNIWLHGLYICPDIDTIVYGLADMLDRRQGWGVKNDSFSFIGQMEMLGEHIWFKIGDRDLATHLLRTNLLKSGMKLSEITDRMRCKYSLMPKIIPATDDVIQTKIITDRGEMHIQEFWVKYHGEPNVRNIEYSGASSSRAHPSTIDALKRSKIIVIPPANPITSIGPIVAIKGIREELIVQKKKIIGVSPMIGNEAVSGPAAKYMKARNLENSAIGVAKYYSNFLSRFVISRNDHRLSYAINRLGIKPYETDIIMRNDEDEIRLASYIVKRSESFRN